MVVSSFDSSTIIAVATAPQNGALGVVRLSGPEALTILSKIFLTRRGRPLQAFKPRYMYFGKIVAASGKTLDEAMAVFMPAPRSFTGEDVVELHCHGNQVLLRKILREILELSSQINVRAAEPGEFTRRAFLNGKMDLTRAEAVHELITSESEAALESSLANLDGALQKTIHDLRAELLVALALVEASFEFPEEDIQTFDREQVLALVARAITHIEKLCSAFATSQLLDNGVSVALVGPPNVGKSSLLNALLAEDRAIVTEFAGTTRDVIEGYKIIGGVKFILRDTAGLRETDDHIENAGIRRSEEWILKSDIVLWISDDAFTNAPPVISGVSPTKPVYKILNKIDLLTLEDSQSFSKQFDVSLSAKDGRGLSDLEGLLLSFLESQNHVHNNIHINVRQYRILAKALCTLKNIEKLQCNSLLSEEILAEELRETVKHLQEITGEISGEDVLGEVFKRFCIGK